MLSIDWELQKVTIMLAYLIASALILSVKREDPDWKAFHTFLENDYSAMPGNDLAMAVWSIYKLAISTIYIYTTFTLNVKIVVVV